MLKNLEDIVLSMVLEFPFVRNKDYFKAKLSLREFRNELGDKKVQVLRLEKTLMKLILSFFPDPYIHDIKLSTNENTGKRIINVGLLSFKERGIAIGRSGDYIKAINEIIENHVIFEEYATFERYKVPLKIKCETVGVFE